MNKNIQLLSQNHNLILTGAPGTGKTYLAKRIAKQMIFGEVKDKLTEEEEMQFNEQCEFVQFHPSYDYTDFVEGLRPDKNGSFNLEDGVFKKFCVKALENVVDSEKNPEVLSKEYRIEEEYRNIIDKFNNGEIGSISYKNTELKIDTITAQDTIYFESKKGGSSYPVSLNRIKKLSVCYPNKESLDNIPKLVEGIKAAIGGNSSPAAFRALLHKIYESIEDNKDSADKEVKSIEKKNFVFIIDEINRGEISKIFGELFFSIEPGYRGEEGSVLTQYSNMQTEAPNPFDDKLKIKDRDNYGHFFVPENVYIIGTMNDIDRSVESMDFAFRRRFAFKEITAKETQNMLDDDNAWKDDKGNVVKPSPDIIDIIKNRMNNLNNAIWNEEKGTGIEGLSSAYHIGASYFLKLANYKNEDGTFDFGQLWDNHLNGLLFEYLRGTQNIKGKMEKLKSSYDNESASDNG